MESARKQIQTDPFELAQKHIDNNEIVLYSVAAGIVGVTPGFDDGPFPCKNIDFTYDRIWMGADVISC